MFQEAFGVNGHIRDVTARFAAAGFVAISPELFHRAAPGFDGQYDDFPTAMKQLQQVRLEGLDAAVRAVFAWLDRAGVGGNAAAVGYCFGGRVAFVANSAVPLKAAVSFYGGHIPTLLDRAPRLSGPMLFVWGGLDHHISTDQRRAVIAGVTDATRRSWTYGVLECGSRILQRRPTKLSGACRRASLDLTLSFLDTYCPG